MKPFPSLTILAFFIFLFGCRNNADEKQMIADLTDSISISGLSGDSIKLVKTASINFKVKDVEQGIRAVSGLAQKYGGMLSHQYLETVEGERKELKISTDSLMVISANTPRADITARIPSGNLEAFMYSIADIGYFTSSSKLDIDDKSLDYLKNELKQKNRMEVLFQPTPKKSSGFAKPKSIGVKDEIIEQAISNRAIDADVKYSTITLNLYQNPLVRKEVIANYYIAGYTLTAGKRWSAAISNGWEYFVDFILVITQLWVFIIAVLLICFSYRYWQQKKKLVA